MFVNEAKYNGILFWLDDHDWGRSIVDADKEPVLGAGNNNKGMDYKMNPTDLILDAYIWGKDTDKKIEKLNAYFQSEKPGWLELPRLGKIKVKFKDNGFRFRFEGRKENYCKMTLIFEKAEGEKVSVKITKINEDISGQVDELKAEAEKSFLEKLNEKFTLDGFPEFVKMQTFDSYSNLTAKLSKLTANNLVSSVVDPLIGSVDILTSGKDGIFSAISSYLKFDGSSYINQIRACLGIAKSKSNIKPASSSPNDAQVYENAKALDDLSKEIAISNACDIASQDVFETKDQINDFVDELLEVSNEVALNSDSFEVQRTLFNLVNMTINKVVTSKKTATSKTIVTNVMLPSAVIAHRYGVAEDKLIRINNIRHPLFMPAGVELEV